MLLNKWSHAPRYSPPPPHPGLAAGISSWHDADHADPLSPLDFGVPSERWGETPHAFVVLRSGATATEPELIAFVRDRLAHFKAPRAVTFVEELPKTATGKLQKYVLRGGAANLSQQ